MQWQVSLSLLQHMANQRIAADDGNYAAISSSEDGAWKFALRRLGGLDGRNILVHLGEPIPSAPMRGKDRYVWAHAGCKDFV